MRKYKIYVALTGIILCMLCGACSNSKEHNNTISVKSTETDTTAPIYSPTETIQEIVTTNGIELEPSTEPVSESLTESVRVETAELETTEGMTEAGAEETETTEEAQESEEIETATQLGQAQVWDDIPIYGTVLTNVQGNTIAIQNTSKYSTYVSDIYTLINQERAAAGVSVVTLDDTLTTMAMHRAAENAYMDWMVTDGTHHIRPNGDVASSICYYYGQTGSFGENLGRYQKSSVEIVQGWHDSPAHYKCMINAKYVRVGVGVAQDSQGYYYWAAIFMD